VSVEPAEDLCDAPLGQSHAGIRRAVVQVDPVAICIEGVPAWECDVADIAFAFVRRFRPEDLRVATQQTLFGGFSIEQRGTEPYRQPVPVRRTP
jgi:hypothetical protein